MITKESVQHPQIGMKANHEQIYNGGELMEVVGLRKDQVELRGDYSGGTNPTSIGEVWYPIAGLFRFRKIFGSKHIPGDYVSNDHYYRNGVKINH